MDQKAQLSTFHYVVKTKSKLGMHENPIFGWLVGRVINIQNQMNDFEDDESLGNASHKIEYKMILP